MIEGPQKGVNLDVHNGAEKPGMYLGFFTTCLRDMALKDKARWAAENRFKALEIACWPNEPLCDIDVATLTQAQADSIVAYMKDFGLKISSLGYYDNNLDADPSRRKVINGHVCKCIDAAAMLGVSDVGTLTGRNVQLNIRQNFDEFEEVFQGLARYAKTRGVRLMVENCPSVGWLAPGQPGSLSFTPELWAEMFRRVPDSSFGLNYDPSHFVFQQIDYLSPVREFQERIFHVHAKDAEIFEERLKRVGIFDSQLDAANGFWRYRLPGHGQIDFPTLIQALRDIGYHGAVSIEHEDTVYEGNPENVKSGLKIGRDYLSRFIDKND